MLKTLAGVAPVVYVEEPKWTEGRFLDPDAQWLWGQLPASLQRVAVAEFGAGNNPRLIQLDSSSAIVLLAFEDGPRTVLPADPDLMLHTHYAHGNYCYDGTRCTLESAERRSFLAFDDPEWVEGAV